MDNIHVIKSDKFKNNAVSLIIPLDLDDKVTDYNLLAALLKRGCVKYPTTKDIWTHLQDLYGAVFDIVVSKKGENLFLNFYIQCIDDRFALNGEEILDDALDFLYEIVSNPLVDSHGFNQTYFDTEKENLKVLINSRIDNKDSYAVERTEEILTEGEPYSIYKYGSIERLEAIKNSELPALWKKIYNEANKLFFICGNVDENDVRQKLARFKGIICSKLNSPKAGMRQGINEVIDKMEVNQGKLCLGCRSNITIFDGDYYGFAVMNSILGGGTHSKLFNEVREKNSLAYYSYSFIEKFKGLLIIASGIDFSNYEKAKDICIDQIKEMKNGNITEYELTSAKKKLISDLRTISDSQYSLIDYLSALRAYSITYTIEEITEELNKVTLERVIQCANSIELNAIYYLTKQ